MSGELRALGMMQTAAEMVEVCTVEVGRSRFGLPIGHIVEIIGSTSPQPVPLAPEFVGGLVHYRGDVLTTVSLRRLMGMPDAQGPQSVLVLEHPGGCFGLQVDAVKEVLTVRATDYEPNPCTLNDRRKGIYAGAYKLKDGLLVMLDALRLDPMRLSAAQAA